MNDVTETRNTVGAAVGALMLAVPVCVQEPATTRIWMPAGGAALLVTIAVGNARVTSRRAIPLAATWLVMAAVSASVCHFLAGLLAGVS